MKRFQVTKPSPSWSPWTETWGNWCCSICAGRHLLCGKMCGTRCRPSFLGELGREKDSWMWAKSASKQAKHRRGTRFSYELDAKINSRFHKYNMFGHSSTLQSLNCEIIARICHIYVYQIWYTWHLGRDLKLLLHGGPHTTYFHLKWAKRVKLHC